MRHRAELASFGQLLEWRAAEQPAATAFTWLGSDLGADRDLSYAELDRRARLVADVLAQAGPPGERALLVFAPGLDFVAALFGCFYAGWIAVPAYPPSLNQHLTRVQAVARDAQPRVALTSPALLQQLLPRVADDPDLAPLDWRASAGEAGAEPSGRAARDPSAADVAVLQYTSGSTAAPRGVMLTHANLLHNAAQIERRFDVRNTPHSQGVIWLPPYHDMGLVGGILEGVYAGFPIALMAPVAFLQRPRRWLEAISRTHATISGGPNFAYDLCVDRIPAAERANLDLSRWKIAFNGSEPIRAATLRRFSDAFSASGFRDAAFYPCYGLAEATLMAAGGRAAEPPVVDDTDRVSCGSSIDDQHLIVVDPLTRAPCAVGETGEVWLCGPSVAAGYWRQPALTASVFNARLCPDDDARRYLRTGDLGFVADGELFITGRLKAVLILGGRKVHAEDVEASLATGGPGGTIALSVDVDGEERLVLVHELEKHAAADLAAVTRAIRLRVAAVHQLPVWAIALTRHGRLPRTSSGKVQRAVCRDAYLSGQLETVYEWRANVSATDPGSEAYV